MKFPIRVSSKALALSLLATTFPMTQSCSDEEVATGAAVVAVGAAVVAVGVGGVHGSPSCGSYEHEVCHSYRDYWGRWVQECRVVTENTCYPDRHDHDGWHHRHGIGAETLAVFDNDLSAAADLLASQPVADFVSKEEWAGVFGMSDAAAQTMIAALEKAKTGSLAAITDLGLSGDDARTFAQLRMPSNKGVDALARKLNQSPADTRGMLYKMIAHGFKMKNVECAKPAGERAVSAVVCG